MSETKNEEVFKSITESSIAIKAGLDKLAEFSALPKLTPEQNDEAYDIVYEVYAECLDMQQALKDVNTFLRRTYKVKESEIKKWINESQEDEKKE